MPGDHLNPEPAGPGTEREELLENIGPVDIGPVLITDNGEIIIKTDGNPRKGSSRRVCLIPGGRGDRAKARNSAVFSSEPLVPTRRRFPVPLPCHSRERRLMNPARDNEPPLLRQPPPLCADNFITGPRGELFHRRCRLLINSEPWPTRAGPLVRGTRNSTRRRPR